jgi:hypothetical protein
MMIIIIFIYNYTLHLPHIHSGISLHEGATDVYEFPKKSCDGNWAATDQNWAATDQNWAAIIPERSVQTYVHEHYDYD